MACASSYIYNDATFRAQFPQLSDMTTYPEATLQMYWDQAGGIVQNTTYGFLPQTSGSAALYLLTAHLAYIGNLLINGQTPTVTTAAGIDKISVTLLPPPAKDFFQFWLSSSPYGLQLLAILEVAAVGGFYSPGSLGRQGFTGNGAWGGAWGGSWGGY